MIPFSPCHPDIRRAFDSGGTRWGTSQIRLTSRYDPTSAAVSNDLPIAPHAGWDQPNDLTAPVDFKGDQYRRTPRVHSNFFCLERRALPRFRIQGKDYGIAYQGDLGFEDNPYEMLLSRFRLHPRKSFRYEYDATANWRVNIRLEQILLQEPQRTLPVCAGGRGAVQKLSEGFLSRHKRLWCAETYKRRFNSDLRG